MIGQIVGNYKIVEKIGEGGMGAVYKGIDLMLEREIAIKALKPELGSQPQVVERFRSEAVTLAKLNHPNVATLYSFFRQGNDFFMVLEFVRGETLDKTIRTCGAMSCERAIPLFCQVLAGIDHAHRYGIVHRDIKPTNVMLTDTGSLKVLDFGIARVLGTARLTKAGHLIGTVEYMSPEQIRGQETDTRTDIYAAGVLLYEMLTGRVPFSSDSEYELMKAQVEQAPPPPREFAPCIPEAVEQAIMRAIAKHPDYRFQTAGEFRTVLLSAGYATTGALDSSAPDASPHVTTRLSNPQFNATASPSKPPVPTIPISHDAMKETRSGPPSVDAMAPTIGDQPSSQSKETRLGEVPAGTASQPKETRLGAPGVGVQSPHRVHVTDQPPASFFSKLTWIHYAGAGVAALVLLVAFVAIPLMAGGEGSKKNPASSSIAGQPVSPSTPLSTAPESPSASPATLPVVTQPVTASGGDPDVLSNDNQPVVTEITPLQTGAANASSGASGTSGTSKPAAKAPSKSKPNNDAAAAARARRRKEALEALEQ